MMMDEQPETTEEDGDLTETGAKSKDGGKSAGGTQRSGSGDTRRSLDGSGDTR